MDWMIPFFMLNGLEDNLQVYDFEETPKISTYLYAICAGTWKVF
jgi:aminopeptidase N